MAIQMRRGPWSQFDPTKMLPGEWAVILSGHPDTSNGQALYHCFAAGVVKQIATIEDAATIIANATEDIREELTQDIASALAQVGAATNAANAATANANTATSAANAATQAATSASERAEYAIDAMGDISELAVPLMSKDVRGGAKLEENGGLVLRDEKLGIGSLVQESDGAVRGGIAGLTAEGHAEQATTTGKNLLPNNATSRTINGVTFTVNADGSVTANGTATSTIYNNIYVGHIGAGTYCLSDGIQNRPVSTTVYINGRDTSGTARYSIATAENRPQITISSDIYNLDDFSVGIQIPNGTVCNNLTFYPQLELGSTATEYEPYTGGLPSPRPDWEQPIEVVRGRNLLDLHALFDDTRFYAVNSDGTVTVNASDYRTWVTMPTFTLSAGTYFVSQQGDALAIKIRDITGGSVGDYIVQLDPPAGSAAFTLTSKKTLAIKIDSGSYPSTSGKLQLTLGSTPQPYVPYGHVGMEARDPDTDELISCTALPLPSRGWVGSLPDGTADVLTLDGAGKVTWEKATNEVTFDGSSDESWTKYTVGQAVSFRTRILDAKPNSATYLNALLITCGKVVSAAWVEASSYGDATIDGGRNLYIRQPNVNVIEVTDFVTWLQSHPTTVLYASITSVTEELGYIEDWPTDIPEDAVISIPELDAVNIEYFIDSTVTELARQWYERAKSEYEGRISALEQAVAELATA